MEFFIEFLISIIHGYVAICLMVSVIHGFVMLVSKGV